MLAAGTSSRFGGNKIVAPAGPCGEWLMEYAIYDALLCGCSRVVLVGQPAMEEVMLQRMKHLNRKAEVVFVPQQVTPERKKPWGTASAFLLAARQATGRLMVMNGDDYYGQNTVRSLADWLQAHPRPEKGALPLFTVAATVHGPQPVWRARCDVTTGGVVTGIREQQFFKKNNRWYQLDEAGEHEVNSGTQISMNCWILSSHIAELIHPMVRQFIEHSSGADELTLAAALGMLLQQQLIQLFGLPANEEWFGLTHADDLTFVQHRLGRLVQAGRYPAPLWR